MAKGSQRKPPPSGWVSEAKRLLVVKTTETWRLSHRSFSAWLRDQSKAIGVQPSVLWREVAALEYYSSLGSEYDGLPLPDIMEVGAVLAPQHLELIEKLSRSADRATIKQLLQRALAGTLPRRDLSEMWRIHKAKGPMEDRRGRGVAKKARDTRSPAAEQAAVETTALLQLSRAAPNWTGCETPTLYRTFITPGVGIGPHRRRVDFIALIQRDTGQTTELHGLEIKHVRFLAGPKTLSDMEHQLAGQASNFNYFWLAVVTDQPVEPSDEQRILAGIEHRFGVVEICGAGVRVLRPASRSETAQTTAVLAGLLASR